MWDASQEAGAQARSTEENAHDIQSRIGVSTLRCFVELAKMDHLVFKFNIYKVFFGLDDLTPDRLSAHTNCRLGKWYYEGAGQHYRKLDGYSTLETPHKQVHLYGRQALEQRLAGDLAAAVVSLAQMEAASAQVQDCLERIAQHGAKQPELFGAESPDTAN